LNVHFVIDRFRLVGLFDAWKYLENTLLSSSKSFISRALVWTMIERLHET